DRHGGGHAGQGGEQGLLAAAGRDAQQDRVAGAVRGEPLVGAQLLQHGAQRFGAVVVFEEEADLTLCGGPGGVPVRAYTGGAAGGVGGGGVRGGGVLLGPPARQPGVRVGAGVPDEVDEQLVGAEQVGQAAAADDAFGALDVGARRLGLGPVGVVELGRVDHGAER